MEMEQMAGWMSDRTAGSSHGCTLSSRSVSPESDLSPWAQGCVTNGLAVARPSKK